MAIESTGAGTAAGAGTGSGGANDTTRRGGMADQLRNRASDALTHQKDRAAQGLGSIVEAVRSTGRNMGDVNQPGIARYINNAADSMQRWVQTFEHKDIREIVEDVQQFGRQRPALFIGASFGAGLLGARFLKSSARDTYGSYRDRSFSNAQRDTSASGERDTYTAQRSTGTVRGTNYGPSGNMA